MKPGRRRSRAYLSFNRGVFLTSVHTAVQAAIRYASELSAAPGHRPETMKISVNVACYSLLSTMPE